VFSLSTSSLKLIEGLVSSRFGVLFSRANEKAPHEWTSLTLRLLAKAPDPVAVFNEIAARLYPTGWNGSLAAKLEMRLQLLEQLDLSGSPELVAASETATTMTCPQYPLHE